MATAPIHVPDATHEPAAYKRAILDLASDADPFETLAATIPAWRELTEGLTHDQLTSEPSPGEWSIAQITAHLFDVDLVFGFRGRLILTEDRPTYPGYNEKAWTPLPRPPYAELLDAWQGLRTANLLIFRAAPPEAATRQAVHQEQGPETFDEIVRKLAGHDLAHLNQMRRTVETTR